jgi:hypothetical protein
VHIAMTTRNRSLLDNRFGICIAARTCVPMTTDARIATDEYTHCRAECSVFGSREVVSRMVQ